MNIHSAYSYIGNCVNLFDEEGQCSVGPFIDATDFAQQLEDADKVDKEEFEEVIDVPRALAKVLTRKDVTYYYLPRVDAYVAQIDSEDVEYIFT